MQDAQSEYTSGQPRRAWFIKTIQASVERIGRLESLQVIATIVLGVLEFASLGVCGGQAQHRRAVVIWRYVLALAVIAVMAILAARFPFIEAFR